jgi:hypothetical protein
LKTPDNPGCLHAELGDAPAAQPVGQRQQLAAGGAEGPGLLLAAAGLGVAGHPDGDLDLGPGDARAGHPLMSSVEVRPFRRSDREQLTQLVNTHAAAVVPGMGVSVSTVLSALERQPGEFIEDPWVSERVTLVAEQQDRIAAAAHLLRYFSDERAGKAARDVGEIHWLLFWPEAPAGNPCWPDATDAAEALMAACIRRLEAWGVTHQHADGELPVRGVYGVPEQWPHIRAFTSGPGSLIPGTPRSSTWPGSRTCPARPRFPWRACRCAGRSG